MTLPNPYEAPQSTLTHPPLSEDKKLPAIVGVGSTLTFWTTLLGCLFYVTTALIMWFDSAYEANGLYRLLDSLHFWIIPIPMLLGYFLLFQVPEATGAKNYCKWTMILYAANWSCQIALFYEKHPEEVPGGVIMFFILMGLTADLCFSFACLQISRHCEDALMIRWSKLAFFFSICHCLLITIDYGLRMVDPAFMEEVPFFAILGSTRVYELYWFSQWISWLGLVVFNCRTLWRIPAHAETEARPKLEPTEDTAVARPERGS